VIFGFGIGLAAASGQPGDPYAKYASQSCGGSALHYDLAQPEKYWLDNVDASREVSAYVTTQMNTTFDADVTLCKELCDSYDDCEGFNYLYQDNRCYFRKDITAPTDSQNLRECYVRVPKITLQGLDPNNSTGSGSSDGPHVLSLVSGEDTYDYTGHKGTMCLGEWLRYDMDDESVYFSDAQSAEDCVSFIDDHNLDCAAFTYVYNVSHAQASQYAGKCLYLREVTGYRLHDLDLMSCYTREMHQNCVGSFGEWSACEGTCGTEGKGIRSRVFAVTQAAQGLGIPCAYSNGFTQTTSCRLDDCPAVCEHTSCKLEEHFCNGYDVHLSDSNTDMINKCGHNARRGYRAGDHAAFSIRVYHRNHNSSTTKTAKHHCFAVRESETAYTCVCQCHDVASAGTDDDVAELQSPSDT